MQHPKAESSKLTLGPNSKSNAKSAPALLLAPLLLQWMTWPASTRFSRGPTWR
jgi:hypothetical protein